MNGLRRRVGAGMVGLVVGVLAVATMPAAGFAASSPDFTVAVSPQAASVTAGASASTKVSTASSAGFVGSVAFSTSKLPSGVGVAFSVGQAPVGDTIELTFTTSPNTPAGTYPISVTATQVVLTAGPLAHSATFSLTVQAASSSPALSTLFVRSYGKLIRGLWQGPLPSRCSNGTTACTLDYSNLPLADRLKSVVVLSPSAVPNLTLETFHFTDGFGTCNPDGSLNLTGVSGIADGPFPGTVHFIEGAFGGAGGPLGLGPHSYGGFYSIDSPGFTNVQVNNITGFIQGTIFGSCNLGFGISQDGHYDAMYSFFGSAPPREDAGTVLGMMSRSTAGSTVIDMTLTAATGLPGGASLAPPAPVCPPGGCT
jgi:hypothetical protein